MCDERTPDCPCFVRRWDVGNLRDDLPVVNLDSCGKQAGWSYSSNHYLPTASSIPSGGFVFCTHPHTHTHTHTHTHRSPFHTQKKNSNPTSSMSSPPTRHSALNGLKVSVQPSVVQTLNARAFLTYHRSLTSSIHMVVIGLNNLSGWVNKVFTLLSAVERLNRHFCTRRHKQTGKARENEEMQKEQPVN